jgi:hypothetical protein
MGFNLTHMDVAPLPDGKIDAYDTDKQRGTLYCFKNLTHMRRALIKNAPYDAKVKVLIKSAKAVIIEPSLVKYDERLFRHMSFELVHMINIYLINGQSYIESDIIGFEPV